MSDGKKKIKMRHTVSIIHELIHTMFSERSLQDKLRTDAIAAQNLVQPHRSMNCTDIVSRQ